MKLQVTWKVHLPSAANESHANPMAVSGKRAKYRNGIMMRMQKVRNFEHKPPYKVTLTRIAKKQLDQHDNIRHAWKGCVDGICKMLGVKDDNDRRLIDFEYRQERGENAIRVEVECK